MTSHHYDRHSKNILLCESNTHIILVFSSVCNRYDICGDQNCDTIGKSLSYILFKYISMTIFLMAQPLQEWLLTSKSLWYKHFLPNDAVQRGSHPASHVRYLHKTTPNVFTVLSTAKQDYSIPPLPWLAVAIFVYSSNDLHCLQWMSLREWNSLTNKLFSLVATAAC